MNTECPECKSFIDETERLFNSTFQQYNFTHVVCEAEREGRECRVMYDSILGRLLFLQQDGALMCCLGSRRTEFPPFVLIHGRGDYGWYHVTILAEIATGKTLLSEQFKEEVINGRIYYYEWQAKLLEEQAEQLFALLEPETEAELARRVEQYVQQRLKRYQ